MRMRTLCLPTRPWRPSLRESECAASADARLEAKIRKVKAKPKPKPVDPTMAAFLA